MVKLTHIQLATFLSLCPRIYNIICFYATVSILTKYHWRFNFDAVLNIGGFISFEKTFRKITGLSSLAAISARIWPFDFETRHGLKPHVAEIIIDHIGISLPSRRRSDAPHNLFRKPQDCHGRECLNATSLMRQLVITGISDEMSWRLGSWKTRFKTSMLPQFHS